MKVVPTKTTVMNRSGLETKTTKAATNHPPSTRLIYNCGVDNTSSAERFPKAFFNRPANQEDSRRVEPNSAENHSAEERRDTSAPRDQGITAQTSQELDSVLLHQYSVD